MKIDKFLFLIPLFFAIVISFYIFFNRRNIKIKALKVIRQRSLYKRLIFTLERKLIPLKKNRLYQWYEERLKYTSWSVAKYIIWRLLFLVLILMAAGIIRVTDIKADSQHIFRSYSYYMEPIYSLSIPEEMKESALEQEVYFLNQALSILSPGKFKNLDKIQVEAIIYDLIAQSNNEQLQPNQITANKVYYRLRDFYQIKQYHNIKFLITILILNVFPLMGLGLYNLMIKGDKKRELRFLKRLIILNGSIKPVDFIEVLVRLIDKSKYYEKMLRAIERENKKNTVSNQTIYRQFIHREKDIDIKLFLEKLDQANNYDFDQAIINIENEFKLERRQQIRKVRKQIEFIHAWGIIGSFLLIALLTVYMLRPWLTAYDMNQLV
ncbi:hypothetical protein [Alkaliphilus crotonatoxidans]